VAHPIGEIEIERVMIVNVVDTAPCKTGRKAVVLRIVTSSGWSLCVGMKLVAPRAWGSCRSSPGAIRWSLPPGNVFMANLLMTCRLHSVDPCTDLVDVLQRVNLHPARNFETLTSQFYLISTNVQPGITC